MRYEQYTREIEPANLPAEDRICRRKNFCHTESPDHAWVCTKTKGHSDDHVAHGSDGRAIARWGEDPKPTTTWDSDFKV